MADDLPTTIVQAAGQAATVRVGTVVQVTPTLQVSLGGTILDNAAIGFVDSGFVPAVGQPVVLLGQSVQGGGTSGATWLVLGASRHAVDVGAVSAFLQLIFTTTSLTFATGTAPQTFGRSFIAPPNGKVTVHWSAEMAHGASFLLVSPQLALGDVVGAGVVHAGWAASDDRQIRNDGTPTIRSSDTDLATGLIPGAAYNVTLYHRVGGGTATIGRRRIVITPVD